MHRSAIIAVVLLSVVFCSSGDKTKERKTSPVPVATSSRDSCLSCYGKGVKFTRCSVCEGSASLTVSCPRCKGKGYARTVPSPIRCVPCNGAGTQQIRCTHCRDRVNGESGHLTRCSECRGN